MRLLLVFLLLGAIAVAVALFARINVGYVLVVSPPYRLEISLNAFLLVLAALFTLLYLVVRFARRLSRLPAEVREHRRAQQVERARARQDEAVVGLLEGRYGRAKQAAEAALAIPHSSGLAALIGARAALEMRDFAGAQALLGRADAQVGSLAVPRMMLEAELALEQGRPADALARLAELKREAGSHTAALRLELRTLTQAGRHAETPPLIDQLHKRKVYDTRQAELLRATAHAEALAGAVLRPAGPARVLAAPARERARAAAGGALPPRGASWCWAGIARRPSCSCAAWSGSGSRRWSTCTPTAALPDATRQLETAERWLPQHSQDAVLLAALGRLCERQQLWGKAQTYFEASLALDDQWRTHVALGELLARIGAHEAASAHLAAALRLAMAALGATAPASARPGGGRRHKSRYRYGNNNRFVNVTRIIIIWSSAPGASPLRKGVPQ